MVFDRSNGIYRGVVFAVAGLILIGAGGKPTPHADTKQAQAAQPVASKADNTDPIVPKTDKSDSKDHGCKQGHDDRQSDLCAQWKAADAATDAARSSDTQTFIGWIGLLLGGITMGAAIAAALYARRAAVATEETVKIAQDAAAGADSALNIANRNADAASELVKISADTTRRELRAYVFLQDMPGARMVAGEKIVIPFKLINVGKTPADNLKFASTVFARENDWTYEDEGVSGVIKSAHALAPNEGKIVFCSSDVILSKPTWDHIIAGTSVLYISGIVFYDDCFGNAHQTEMRAHYECNSGKIALCAEGNNMT